jgi:hypothetical protein
MIETLSALKPFASDPHARDLVREWLREADGSQLPATKDHINDVQRLQRMDQLVRDAMQKHRAARQACDESPAGASGEACERRLVRKYDRIHNGRYLP